VPIPRRSIRLGVPRIRCSSFIFGWWFPARSKGGLLSAVSARPIAIIGGDRKWFSTKSLNLARDSEANEAASASVPQAGVEEEV
jgi:hypothetical protein